MHQMDISLSLEQNSGSSLNFLSLLQIGLRDPLSPCRDSLNGCLGVLLPVMAWLMFNLPYEWLHILVNHSLHLQPYSRTFQLRKSAELQHEPRYIRFPAITLQFTLLNQICNTQRSPLFSAGLCSEPPTLLRGYCQEVTGSGAPTGTLLEEEEEGAVSHLVQ